ncbi:TetR/AcrR family transcriptional regulator [Ureibacillus thermophilus]|uniref:TetR/AcrR family transcriptional regulator n=1 Tax=Ureibacillus thermophilus TaxID=367743 RepID=UPI00362047F8
MRTKGERSKQHILEVASMLFSKNSFKNVTIRQIAKEAGISPSLIYKYFHTQEDLYYAALQSACQDLLERLKTIDRLEDFVHEYLRYMFSSALFEMMSYFSLEHDSSKNFIPISNEINKFLQLLEEKISGPNAKIEAQLLFSTLNGLIISYKKVPRDTEAKIATIQKLADYYIANLKKRI